MQTAVQVYKINDFWNENILAAKPSFSECVNGVALLTGSCDVTDDVLPAKYKWQSKSNLHSYKVF